MTKISIGDRNYPNKLVELVDKPKKIYCDGDIDLLDGTKMIAIVGSRKMTSYGERVLDKFIPQFVSAGFVVISGFMYGVDTHAHKLTIESGGKTIVVLGSGIKAIYPTENKELYNKIIKMGGLVISEYDPDQKPKPWMFAKRNRIIAALATSGVIVVEAGLNSGSIITANRAIELNRPLYAVPGNITSTVSKGTNRLIFEKKAQMLLDVSQITNSHTKNENGSKSINLNNKLQTKIYELLENEDLTVDQITAKLNINAQEISSSLMELEFEGIVLEDRGLFRISAKL